MKRSILTEKVARRGYHVSREYAVDPLELLSVGDVMTTPVVTIPASLTARELLGTYFLGDSSTKHQGYPVVDADGNLLGVITRSNLLEHWVSAFLDSAGGRNWRRRDPIIAYDLIAARADHGVSVGIVPDRGRAHGRRPTSAGCRWFRPTIRTR